MTSLRLLDLFSGAGGAAVGYARAGFSVTGVDIEHHADYPYELIVANALDVLRDLDFLAGFDVVHASPPCPRYSVSTVMHDRSKHPDLLGPVRHLLRASGRPYVIENVPGAPMPDAVMICGQAMGMPGIRRHRLFESNVPLMSPGCACDGRGSVSAFGHSGEDRRRATLLANDGRVSKHVALDELRTLLGVPWMTRREDVADAIPPQYTEHVGSQLIDHLAAEREAVTTP